MFLILILLGASAKLSTTQSFLQFEPDNYPLFLATPEEDFVASVAALSADLTTLATDVTTGNAEAFSADVNSAVGAAVNLAAAGAALAYDEAQGVVAGGQYIASEVAAQVASDLSALAAAIQQLVVIAETTVASVDTSSISTFVESEIAAQISLVDTIYSGVVSEIALLSAEYSDEFAAVETAAVDSATATFEYVSLLGQSLAAEIASIEGLAVSLVSGLVSGSFDGAAFAGQVSAEVAAAQTTIGNLIAGLQALVAGEIAIVQNTVGQIDLSIQEVIGGSVEIAAGVVGALQADIQGTIAGLTSTIVALQAELSSATGEYIAALEPALAGVSDSLKATLAAYQAILAEVQGGVIAEVAGVQALAAEVINAAVTGQV